MGIRPVTQPRAPSRVEGYAPLRDYAVIGNKRTAALVALDGSIDWMPHPSLEDPSVLAAVLDRNRGGRFELAPTSPFEVTRRYLPDTNVLETTFTTTGGTVRVTDAMSRPTGHPLIFNQVIRRIDGLAGRVEVGWEVRPRFGYGVRTGRRQRHEGGTLFADDTDVIAVQAFRAGAPETSDGRVTGRFEACEGDVAVIAFSAFRDEPVTLVRGEQLLQRLEATADRWRSWMADCLYDGPWQEAVRRSALALDLLVDDQTGAIAAASTMALPERIGGDRNYDYRYAWLRDANLTLEAMLRLGFVDQVHASLGWMLRTVRRTQPVLRPMYRLNGEPRLPERELPLYGYRGSRPVQLGNPAQGQLQLGNYGDLFDMAVKYVENGHSLAAGAGTRLAETADFVCRIWGRRDSSIWELPEERHYTQGKLACWLALDRAIELAGRGQLPPDHAPRWRRERQELRRYLERRCWSPTLRAYTRIADSDELDAAVLLATRGSFVEEQADRFEQNIDAIRGRLGAGGPLIYRYSGMEGEEGAFIACSFWLVEALTRAGRIAEAAAAMDDLVALANDVGLYSEQIDPGTGEFLGNLPQALSHLALVNAAVAVHAASGAG